MSMCGPAGDGRRDDEAFERAHGFDPRDHCGARTVADQVRDAIRATAEDADDWCVREADALRKLADEISDRSALKLRGLIR